LFSGDTRESGVKGASASLAWGSCSVAGFSSTAGGGPGALCVTVPLLDSSGVMGRADGRLTLRERDRRWGMAGTMRESGRRACLCAAGAVSATMGAMVVVMVGKVRERGAMAAAAPGISSLDSCQLSWSALGRERRQRREGGGMSEGTRAVAMETSDRLADNCGDEAMTHVAVSQRRGGRRRDLSHLRNKTRTTCFVNCTFPYEGGLEGFLGRSGYQPQFSSQISCKSSPTISKQLCRREPDIKVEHTQPEMHRQQETLAHKYHETGSSSVGFSVLVSDFQKTIMPPGRSLLMQ
jgi:hypothetical protein